MNSDNILMIFVKNPELGKVKTRLASTIGEEKALEVYKTLLAHTCTIVNFIDPACLPAGQAGPAGRFDKAVFYSDIITHNDLWNDEKFQKYLQEGEDLGEKMLNAFALSFSRGYDKVVVIGSDCPQLTTEIIEKSFEALNFNEVVIGPAKDGGYYLLGMNKLYKELFQNKTWSSENVLLDTLIDLKKTNIPYTLLETLSDVDREEDLGELKKLISKKEQ